MQVAPSCVHWRSSISKEVAFGFLAPGVKTSAFQYHLSRPKTKYETANSHVVTQLDSDTIEPVVREKCIYATSLFESKHFPGSSNPPLASSKNFPYRKYLDIFRNMQRR